MLSPLLHSPLLVLELLWVLFEWDSGTRACWWMQQAEV